jgi:hypothetical protein
MLPNDIRMGTALGDWRLRAIQTPIYRRCYYRGLFHCGSFYRSSFDGVMRGQGTGTRDEQNVPLAAFINRKTNWAEDELNLFPLPERPDALTPVAANPDELDLIISPALMTEMQAFAAISAIYGLTSGVSSSTFPIKRSKARREFQRDQYRLKYGLRVRDGARMAAAIDSDMALGMQQHIGVSH